jgi:hypothetical protein
LLRGIFGSKKDEVTVGCNILHKEENPTFRMRWPGHVTLIGVKISAYKTWETWRKKRPLGRPKLQCKDNIRMGLKETG